MGWYNECMVKNVLRAFFVGLIIIGGVWWWQEWQNSRGTITPESTHVEEKNIELPKPEPVKKEEEVNQEHQVVEAGVGDWQLIGVMMISLGMSVLMWGLYRASYRIYWLD